MTSLPAENIKKARNFAQQILQRYPDYGKAPDTYVLAIVEVLTTFPERVQAEIADIRHGISARSTFLPTVADIVKLGGEIEARMERYRGSGPQVRRQVDPNPYRYEQIPQFFDKYGNRISEREFEERQRLSCKTVESMKRTERHLAWLRSLGNGSLFDGSLAALEQGLSEPPEDFVWPSPPTPHKAA